MIKYIFLLLLSFSAHASLNEVDKTNVFNKNLLKNGGFENALSQWTAVGTSAGVSTVSPMIGLVRAIWDASASGNTLTSTAVAIPLGMYGRNGVATCLIKTPSGTATHTLQAYDGTNILSSVDVVSSTTPVRASANFVFPSSGNISLRIYANANEPSIDIDDCYLGAAEGYNVGSVSQAEFAGESYYPGTASCIWARTNSAIGAFTADTDCVSPVIIRSRVGTWLTTDSNLPRQTINSLPPGIYKVTFYIPAYSSVTSNSSFAIYDGTTTCAAVRGGATTTVSAVTVSCSFEYTTAGDKTFELYAASETSTITISNDVTTANVKFILEKFPTTSDTAYRPDVIGASWTGHHDNNCAWTRTSATLGDPGGDASCSLYEDSNNNMGTVTTKTDGNPVPGIIFTPKKAGRYYVCAKPWLYSTGANVAITAQLYNDTDNIDLAQTSTTAQNINTSFPYTMCGIVNATSTSARQIGIRIAANTVTVGIATNPGVTGASSHSVTWSIIDISQSVPTPLLVNSVVSKYEGVTRVERASISCSGSSSITSNPGGWLSSIGNIAGGNCATTITAGVFSSAPICTVTNIDDIAGDPGILGYAGVPPTTSTINVDCSHNTGTDCTTYTAHIICVGQK